MNKSIKIIRTNSFNKDFISLVKALDNYLTTINGENDSFFKAFNKIDVLKNVVVVYNNAQLAGCGALKKYNSNCVEIKRMYVKNAQRRKGIAKIILNELELWAKELDFKYSILETSKKMDDAVSLYTNYGYAVISNYAQYKNVKTSVCFKKEL